MKNTPSKQEEQTHKRQSNKKQTEQTITNPLGININICNKVLNDLKRKKKHAKYNENKHEEQSSYTTITEQTQTQTHTKKNSKHKHAVEQTPTHEEQNKATNGRNTRMFETK